MSIKKFFIQQFQLRKFLLKHDVVADFYLCSFQRNRSTIPLLLIRTLIFVGCLSILIASMVLTASFLPFKFWPIYMTHWGLILNTIAAGFGLLVSIVAAIKSPLVSADVNPGLPWYVQVYWTMFNIATPMAFFITVFYWVLLTAVDQDFAIDATLDVFIHAVNSVLMCALVISSRHPAFFLHFYMPIGFSIIYLIFTYIYYVTDGKDPFGNHTIYPMMDWEEPAKTIGIAALSALGITVLHALVVVLSSVRDALTKRFGKDTTYDIHEPYL